MTASAATPVARSRDGKVHRVDVWQPDGVVLTACGNTIVGARTRRLTGYRCRECWA